MPKFKVGDKLIHPVYGLGTLVAIEKETDESTDTDYYVIELGPGEARLATPVDKAQELGLHRPIPKKDRDNLTKLFAGRPRRLDEDYRKRRSSLTDRLREGSYEEIGRVVRDLVWWQSKGKANAGDRRLLKRAKGLLAEELAASDGVTTDEASARIEAALERRISGSEDKGK